MSHKSPTYDPNFIFNDERADSRKANRSSRKSKKNTKEQKEERETNKHIYTTITNTIINKIIGEELDGDTKQKYKDLMIDYGKVFENAVNIFGSDENNAKMMTA